MLVLNLLLWLLVIPVHIVVYGYILLNLGKSIATLVGVIFS